MKMTLTESIVYEYAKIIVYSGLNRAESHGAEVASLRRDIASEGKEGGDGIALVHEVYCYLLAEFNKLQKAPQTMNFLAIFRDYLNTPIIQRKIDKRVIIQKHDSASFSDTETTRLKEAYSIFWKAFRSSANTCDNGKYCYIEDLATDTTGAEEAVYRRLPKYYTAGRLAYSRKSGESPKAESPEAGIYNDIGMLIDRLQEAGMTPAESKVLELRLCGYGNKAIATYLGKSESTIRTLQKRLQARCEKIGLTV